MPPSYGSQDYWDQRFKNETEPFEWLEAPHALDHFISDAVDKLNSPRPRLLHIGCGTSRLSYHLRTLVQEPGQVHNVDYSKVAIGLGRQREQELRGFESSQDPKTSSMQWNAIDLLDHISVLGVCRPSTYSIIVDKSTSDSISCCQDVEIKLPYTIDVDLNVASTLDSDQPVQSIHPLHILAVHLALITIPGGRWIALSYSNDRFPFVDGLYSSRPHLVGFPDTGTLWKLIEKREVESTDESPREGNETSVTHRPKILNGVYILERTTVPLFIRGAHI